MRYHFFRGFLLSACISLAAQADTSFHQNRIIEASRIEAGYNTNKQLITAPDINEYLAKMVSRIVSSEPAAKDFFRIRALQNSLPYIYCLDNGAIYVSTGLIARLQNEAQLAGLLAAEMASIYRQDADSKNALVEKRNEPKRMVPNLLAVVFTGGIAALPILSSQEKETEALNTKLQTETDHLAMQWLVAAGFDTTQPAEAAHRLIQTLTDENRFGDTTLSNISRLTKREEQFKNAATSVSNGNLRPLDEKFFKSILRKFGLELAQLDKKNSNVQMFSTVLTRVENETGKDGESVFMRAEYSREFSTNDLQLQSSTQVYEEAITYKNAPPEAWRELGLLYRHFEKNDAAKKNLNTYLQLKPGAADAPIIKLYIEAL